jgi:hypothetical protein
MIVNDDGSGRRTVTSGEFTGFDDFKISPRTNTIAYTDGSRLKLIEPDSSQKRFLTTGHVVDWSPTGKRLAYFAKDSLFVINKNGKGARIIAPSAAGAGIEFTSADWSPRGQIAYSDNASNCGGLAPSIVESWEHRSQTRFRRGWTSRLEPIWTHRNGRLTVTHLLSHNSRTP